MEWTTGQNYLETAEFVESIPFTETREYVQIVIRNSEVYRQVYGPSPSADRQETRRPGTEPVKTEAMPSGVPSVEPLAAPPVVPTDAQPAGTGELR